MTAARATKPLILILNGSPSGARGNCARWAHQIKGLLSGRAKVKLVHLTKGLLKPADLVTDLEAADGLLVMTGTYWDSWGSPLQRFLEVMTPLESADFLRGKPAAALVLMHSVGGKEVLSRLQGVLSTWGFLIPPQSGMVRALATDLAVQVKKSSHSQDFWQEEDLAFVLENLLRACHIKFDWASWPVDRKDPTRLWLTSDSERSR